MDRARQFRHELHTYPELSGSETGTAARVLAFFAPLRPDRVITGLGGTGVAVEFGTGAPAILLRAELDALPITETNDFLHRSQHAGVSHKCGHDGHMAILARVGERLTSERPANGRVILLFQPAEETGAGARAVCDDPRYAELAPARVFGLHNVPGAPLGQIIVRDGPFTCASRGLSVTLGGTPAHAAQPETGASPARAMADLVAELHDLPAGLADSGELLFATVVGASLGGRNFGVSPGRAEVHATLRSATDTTMSRLVTHCESLAAELGARDGLDVACHYADVFDATINAPAAVDTIRQACHDMDLFEAPEPFRWSEDFGRFTQLTTGAFFGLGAGDGPALHNDDYDFPDALIETGAEAFLRIARHCLEAGAS